MMNVPDSVGPRAARFRDSVFHEYPDPDPDELVLLTELVRAIDESDMLRACIEDEGPMIEGSKGQPVLNPAMTALTTLRKTIGSLCKQLDLFEPEPVPDSPSTIRAREAANARWGMEREKGRVKDA